MSKWDKCNTYEKQRISILPDLIGLVVQSLLNIEEQ